MQDRSSIDQKGREFFENLWKRGDPWDLETSEFEKAKYRRQLKFLEGRRFGRALEIGCGAGEFTRSLVSLADEIVALDISPTAIEEAKRKDLDTVDFRVVNIMDFDLRGEGSWDLIVFAETIYYIGWLYPFFDVAWLVSELFHTTRPGGYCLTTNVFDVPREHLIQRWVIETYRDLFVNVGYVLEEQEVFREAKHGLDLTALICSFRNPASRCSPQTERDEHC